MKRATQTVVQLSVSQCFEKRCAILERTSNGTPNYLRLCVVVREFGNQDGKAMIESAALVMHDVIIVSYGCPNQALRGAFGSVMASVAFQFSPGFASLPFVVDTKGNHCG